MSLLTCKEATRLVSERQDRALGLGEGVALRLHFAICAGCRNVNAQIDFLRRAVRRLAERTDEEKR